MNISSLKKEEAQDLLEHYKSELNKLAFQMERTNDVIFKIENHLKKKGTKNSNGSTMRYTKVAGRTNRRVKLNTVKKSNPTQQGKRQAKVEKISDNVTIVTPPASTRKKFTKKKTRGYRLSEWDNFILETLAAHNKPLVNLDFNTLALEHAKSIKSTDTPEQIRGKIIRSIHKLANKRKAIKKHNISGKGYAYGLAEWFNSAGNLRRAYKKELE